jgi:hypothetical protein
MFSPLPLPVLVAVAIVVVMFAALFRSPFDK